MRQTLVKIMSTRGTLSLCILLLTSLAPSPAKAQLLWSPLDQKPKANMIIAYDTGVTGQIPPGCSPIVCHATWNAINWNGIPNAGSAPWSAMRLAQATTELSKTIQFFANDFIYGGFRYDSCGPAKSWLGHTNDPTTSPGEAEINYITAPNASDVVGSFNAVFSMVSDIANYTDPGPTGSTSFQVCERTEGHLPGNSGATANCLTPNCSSNVAVTNSIAAQLGSGAIPDVTAPNWPKTATVALCTKPGKKGIGIDAYTDLASHLTTLLTVPHCPISLADAYKFCQDLTAAVASVHADLVACTSTVPKWTAGFACDYSSLANDMCGCPAGSTLASTCICEPNVPGCVGTLSNDPCGVPWRWRAQQQLGICTAYAPSMSIGQALVAQPDNVVNPGGCRENALMIFTDGDNGDGPGVSPDGANATNPTPIFGSFANSPYYSKVASVSNAFVLNTSPPLSAFIVSTYPWLVTNFYPDRIAQALGQPAALPATDQASLTNSFAKIANRMKVGSYLTGSPTTDEWGSRVAISGFFVPGRPKAGAPAYPDDSYFGRPTHLSWWQINPKTGQPVGSAPICETDWTTRAGFSGRLLTTGGITASPPAVAQAAIGPPLGAGSTWESGGPMLAAVPDNGTTDRGQGAGVVVNPTKSGGFTFGYMLNGGQTQAVVVGSPHDIPAAFDKNFANFEMAHYTRDRMIYTMAGGYLFAYNGGKYTPLSPPQDIYGVGVAVNAYYDDGGTDNPGYASGTIPCSEVFRYLPGWVMNNLSAPNDPLAPGDHINRMVPQLYTNGQITVRESRVAFSNAPNDYATVLVMTEGPQGPHLSALDVTDPTNPSVLGEWSLPGASDTTSAEPTLAAFPAIIAGHPAQQTAVVIPGGDGGSANLYAFAVKRSGVSLLSQAALPPGNYPSDAVCFDAANRGAITDCVVLSDAGAIVRVAVNTDGTFGAVTNLFPQYSSVFGAPMAGEKFYTHPAVYFTADNSVAYVFGSGDVKNLGVPPPVANNVYKVVDSSTHPGGSASGTSACANSGGFGTSGLIPLASADEVVTSPPVVNGGVVAFTTYSPGSSGCTYGNANIYAMNYQTCIDATTPSNGRPQPVSIGSGIPTSPLFIRTANSFIGATTKQIFNMSGGTAQNVVKTQAGRRSRMQALLWRYEARR